MTVAKADVVLIRNAEPTEIDQIARIWFDGWRDAHLRIVPEKLTRARTLENFRDRIEKGLSNVRVAGDVGSPVGFTMLLGDELDQMFVTASARGSGVAAALISDAETRLAASGVKTAWLTCAIGNDRAARFYEKHGWRRVGVVVSRLQTILGEMDIEVWRYEKDLSQP